MSEDGGLDRLLFDLERKLMDPAVRRNRARVAQFLSEEFREFGSSGRFWTREATLDLLASEDGYAAPQVEDFTVLRLAHDTALVTYRTVRGEVSTLRSSIWVQRGNLWQVLFHQGTRIPA